MIQKNSQSHTTVQFLDSNSVLWIQDVRGIYWNVAHTTFIIFYVETKIYSNFEVSILYTGWGYVTFWKRSCAAIAAAISKRSCDFKTQLRFHDAAAISRSRCDFKTQMRFQNAAAISRRSCDFKTPATIWKCSCGIKTQIGFNVYLTRMQTLR